MNMEVKSFEKTIQERDDVPVDIKALLKKMEKKVKMSDQDKAALSLVEKGVSDLHTHTQKQYSIGDQDGDYKQLLEGYIAERIQLITKVNHDWKDTEELLLGHLNELRALHEVSGDASAQVEL